MQKFVLNEADDLATIANQLERVAAKKAAQQTTAAAAPADDAGVKKVHDVTERVFVPPTATPAVSGARPRATSAHKARPLAVILGAAALVALAGLAAIFIFAPRQSRADTYTVPNLVGQKVVRAQEAVRKAGLRAHLDFDPHSKKPVGTVIAVTPPAGAKAKKGDIITLKVAGKHAVFVDTTPTSAPADQTAQTPTTPPVKQTVPEVKPVEQMTPDKQTNPTAPAPPPPTAVIVPDLTAMTAEKGRARLAELGFATRDALVRVPEQPNGAIVATDPKPGTRVPFGTVVTLQINNLPDASPSAATAPPPPTVTLVILRDYVGMSSQEAVNGLREQGFRAVWEYKPDADTAPGKVITTAPPAGSRLQPGTEVHVYIAR